MDESITVERVRHALVVGRLDADGAAVLLAANLPAKREKTFVVVGASSVDAMTRLDPWVTADLADAIHGDVCVVAPRFGSMGRDGTLPPARLLADRLGVEVTAADGDPVGLADGTVFVPGQTPGWVAFRPGGQRVTVGARLPAPWWQDGLPAPAPHITHVPAGLWVRRADAPPRGDDPLLARVPDLDRMYVVLGAPGELPPARDTVTAVLRALPDEGRDRAVLAWYGSGTMASAMAGAIAEELDAPVRVAHGVPGDGGLVYVDEQGAARWRPFAVESVYRPGRAPVLDRWTAPPTLAAAAPGSFRLAAGWLVDVVPSGLVVRPESLPVVPAAGTGPTADIVFATDGPVPAEVLSRLDGVVRELPADTRAVLRVLPMDERAEEALVGIEAADRVVPAAVVAVPEDARAAEVAPPAGAIVVTADGRVLPAAPILTAPAPITAGPATPTALPAAPAGSLRARKKVEAPTAAMPVAVVANVQPDAGFLVPAAAEATTVLPTSSVPGEEEVEAPTAAMSGLVVANVQPTSLGAAAPASEAPLAAPASSLRAEEEVGAPTAAMPVAVVANVQPASVVVAESLVPAAPGSEGAPAGSTRIEEEVGASAVAMPDVVVANVQPTSLMAAESSVPAASATEATTALPAGSLRAEEEVEAPTAAMPDLVVASVQVGAAFPVAAESPVPAAPASEAPPASSLRAEEEVGAPTAAMPDSVVANAQSSAAFAATADVAAESAPQSATPAFDAVAPATPALRAMVANAQPSAPAEAPRPVTQESEHVSSVDIQNGVLVIALGDADPEPEFDATSTQHDESAPAAIPSVAAASVAPSVTPPPVAAPVQTAPAVASPVAVASVASLLPAREIKPSTPIEIPENVRSTAAQRRAMRAKLGSRYDVATRAVTRLLSERPGLRFGAGDRAALLAELAVVRVFADDPGGQYDADFYVCLADGLRRLPTARTVVVRGIPADTDLEPDAVLRLPTPVVAAPVTTDGVGPAEALIWTTTARRLDGLVDEPPEPDEDDEAPAKTGVDVVLSGHTRLRVLAVEQTPVRRILLAEDGAAPAVALTRLQAAAAARTTQTPGTSRWFGPLPAAG